MEIETFYEHFYPRSPCGERLFNSAYTVSYPAFLSTFPLRGTSVFLRPGTVISVISIHVPLAGNVNGSRGASGVCPRNFYPRSPCGERRGGTLSRFRRNPHFYPRSPCGERPICMPTYFWYSAISIHVPLAGNVRHVAGGFRLHRHFYPRSPCGERPGKVDARGRGLAFLSTFPLRGTSVSFTPADNWSYISIHVPLAGNVQVAGFSPTAGRYFYPRSPCGERRHDANYLIRRLNFYPRSPCGERRKRLCASRRPNYISIHVPLAGNVG